MAAINGVIRSFTKAFTKAVKATPTTTATARSIRLPRRRKSLKSFSTGLLLRDRTLSPTVGSDLTGARGRPWWRGLRRSRQAGVDRRRPTAGGRNRAPQGGGAKQPVDALPIVGVCRHRGHQAPPR